MLVAALGSPADIDVLDAVRAWLPGKPPDELEEFIRASGIPLRFWNRIGD